MSDSKINALAEDEYEDSSQDDSEESSENTGFTDDIHSSSEDSYSEEEEADTVPELVNTLRRRSGSEEFLAEQKRIPHEEPQNYAPDRWPPIIDFLFVFSSFLAAVFAAYFTIF